ncbi:MAG: single-stranded DNA-binding protein [Anaerolineae bacterium]|nr:single-stranded DNA-binding protein [Anaerolineae bacterium]
MYQRVIIVGNVGRDAEMRYTPSGVPVTSFSVAVNRRWNSATGEQQEKTTWFRVTCWRKLAETAGQYVKKGQRILVEGEVEAQAYIDREGTPRGTLELTASNFKFLSARAETGEGPGAGASAGEEEFPVHEDEIPF